MTDMLKHILENRYIKMYRLCSQNGGRERERGRETERDDAVHYDGTKCTIFGNMSFYFESFSFAII